MTIYFGLELEELVYPFPEETEGGIHYFGAKGLLYMLESHLGLIGHPSDNEYLRIEQYRQLLREYLEEHADAFFTISFEADQFATATALLDRRDELVLAGWDFQEAPTLPNRLQVLAHLEATIQNTKDKTVLAAGFSDRFREILRKLKTRTHPIKKVFLNEPLELLPIHFQQLFTSFSEPARRPDGSGIKIENLPLRKIKGQTDLAQFQTFLKSADGLKPKITAKQDGSLIIIKSKRETNAASYLAQLFLKNKQYRPLCLIPEKNRALDNAIIQEGLPSLGILSASLARPSLQILKLIPTFLWRPIDPYKILEFVSLSVKPLADDLARQIANQMAQSPGMRSDKWYIMINRYFDELKTRAANDKNINYQEVRNQYDFWFERRRYDVSQSVPKEDVIEIFEYLGKWSFKAFEDSNGKNNSLLVLSQQAKKVVELLEALPDWEKQLSNLELERIVRTIYEPSPVVFQEREKHHLVHVHKLSSITASVDKLMWWNFIDNEVDAFFSKWYPHELKYLAEANIKLTSPQEKNQRMLWQRRRPILHAQQQVVLVIPQMVEGQEVLPNPLYGDLEACFDNMETLCYNIDNEAQKEALNKYFQTPSFIPLVHHQLGRPKPMVQIKATDQLVANEEETFTSLDSLFYYPYQWAFRYKSKLRKSSILSVVGDSTLMGNLAHRFFELLFAEDDLLQFKKEDVDRWIDDQAYRLLSREGAVLLMYGREPERLAFINKVKYAAWSLLSLIQNNGWKIEGVEIPLVGKFLNIPIKAKADLVIRRGDELAVVDLKWRGGARREKMVKNEEDLQLVMYAKLLTEDHSWAHTAYFIIEQGKMIARNNLAFKEALAVNPDADHIEINERIWDKMEATFQWRLDQLQKGNVEVRTKSTSIDLEDIYAGELMELLEMKSEDAPFDDYRTLINLVE